MKNKHVHNIFVYLYEIGFDNRVNINLIRFMNSIWLFKDFFMNNVQFKYK